MLLSSCIDQGGADVFLSKIRKILRYLDFTRTASQHFEYVGDPNPSSGDNSAPTADSMVNRYSRKPSNKHCGRLTEPAFRVNAFGT